MNPVCSCRKETFCKSPIANPCDLSVVIPVYRSEDTLELLAEKLLPVLDRTGRTYEVIFVEDGSPDQSWDKIESLHRRYPERVIGVQLMRNSGQHNALMCGFRHSAGEFILTMDDDLQNPPEEIPKLLDAMTQSEFDIVYGNYVQKKHEPYRNIGSLMVNSFYRSTFQSHVTVTSFRMIRRPLLEAILDYHGPYVFIDGLMAWNTRRIGSVIVEHHPRQAGRSTYSIGKLLALATNLFTGFSLLPLQLASTAGIATVLFGVVTVLVGLCLQPSLNAIGTPWLLLGIAVLIGVQLLSLGIASEYLGRLHMNVNGKPQYRIRKVLSRSDSLDSGSLPK